MDAEPRIRVGQLGTKSDRKDDRTHDGQSSEIDSSVDSQRAAVIVQSPWFELAADFLLQPHSDAFNLLSYNRNNAMFDSKNSESTDFIVHFLSALKLILAKSPKIASRRAADGDQKRPDAICGILDCPNRKQSN